MPCLEIKITPYKAPEVSPATFISYFKHNRPFFFFFFFHFLLRTLSEYPSTLLAKFKGGTPEERKFIALQSREIVQRFVRKGARTCPHHTNVCNNSRHCEAISTLGTTGIFSRATRSSASVVGRLFFCRRPSAGHFLRLNRNRKPRMKSLWHPG